MSNPGNSGQKYRMTKLIDVEIVGNTVVHKLECGHDYASEPMWVTVEKLADMCRKGIGKRERCNRCQIKN